MTISAEHALGLGIMIAIASTGTLLLIGMLVQSVADWFVDRAKERARVARRNRRRARFVR